MATTQQSIPVQEIKNNLCFLKDGSFVAILKTSAVNFDLLSDNEQLAIISSFAGLLNSLSFPIQIVIRSKRLDISSYISLLSQAEDQQGNPLLKQMMERYRVFVETIIRENEVLDKQFFVVISVSSLELGVGGDPKSRLQKAQTILSPRIDHLIRQLGRTGLVSEQLSTQKLIKLFYDIYNEQVAAQQVELPPQVQQPPQVVPTPQPSIPTPPLKPQVPQPAQPIQTQSGSSHVPYIVEELSDEYGSV
jgi:hypothetical protein